MERAMKILITMSAVVIAVSAHAAGATADSVPANLRVPDGNNMMFSAHAVGTQNYVCLPGKTGGFAWTLYGPDAVLHAEKSGEAIGVHILSPDASGAAHPSWQGLDGSRAQATATANSSEKPFVADGAVPWLLLKVSGTTPPHGKRATYPFATATYVQRIHTTGGIAPAAGCAVAGDVGAKALMPYEADYVFYGP
jgi:hypothetical protein